MDGGKIILRKVGHEYYFGYEEDGKLFIDVFISPRLKRRLQVAFEMVDQGEESDGLPIPLSAVR